jgi:gliding motility-associated-like protein
MDNGAIVLRKRKTNRIFFSILLLLFMLLPSVNLVGQNTLSAKQGEIKNYKVERQSTISTYTWAVFTDELLTDTAETSDVVLTSLIGRENEVDVQWRSSGVYYLMITAVGTTGCANRMAWPVNVQVSGTFVIAQNDKFFTYKNVTRLFDVAANDYASDDLLDKTTVTIVLGTKNGTAKVTVNGNVSYTPNTDFVGLDSFQYSICNSETDKKCDKAWAFIDVVFNNDIVAINDTVVTGAEEQINIEVLANDYDPENEMDTSSLQITSRPKNGTFVILEDGSVNYTPNTGFAGVDSFTYRICDSGLPSSCAYANVLITIEDRNLPVVANDDYGYASEDNSSLINVLSNDVDPDGTINPATVVITKQPIHGTASVNSEGIVTYTPNNKFFGLDSFTYRICDSKPIVKCDEAVVTINVVEDLPPVAVNDSIGAYNGEGTNYTISQNDYDPDGEIDQTTIKIISQAANGLVSVNQSTGLIMYMPDAYFFGIDSFTYTIADAKGNISNVAKVVINVGINPMVDTDGDGVKDIVEDLNKNGDPTDDDTDADLIPNYRDTDDDNDGLASIDEDQNLNGNPVDDDNDLDGIPNYLDTDDDNDSVLSIDEDVNGDGNYLNDDTDKDGLLNRYDADDDGDYIATIDELGDLDGNDIPDYLEVWNTKAVDDVITIGIDQSANIDVLANDSSHINERTLTIIQDAVNGYSYVDVGNWTVLYTPNINYLGYDSIVYLVCDYQDVCDTALVSINIEDIITVPELFTPNGDGRNDVLLIDGLDNYQNNSFTVYNRWGNKVYENSNYQNSWDGNSNVRFVIGSKELSVGVYYYILKYSNWTKEKTGALFLER